MKKITLTLLGLAAFMTVTGCKATESSTKPAVEKYKTPASEIMLKRASIGLLKDKSYNLETIIKPLAAYDTKLTYVSSDKSIATVDSKGKIVGKNPGHAVVTVYAENFENEEDTPTLFDTIDVYVTKRLSSYKKTCEEFVNYHDNYCPEPDNVRSYDYRDYKLIRNGVVQDSTTEYSTVVVSRTEGLMSYDSYEIDTRALEGQKSYINYGYTVHTNHLFGSRIYRRSGDNYRKYFYAATEDFKTRPETTRYSLMCEILDSFFSVEHDYFTGCMDDINDMSDLKDPQFNKGFGSYRDKSTGEFYLVTNYGGTAQNYDKTSIEDEIRYATQLPEGIPYDINLLITCTYANGYMRELYQKQVRTFKWKGASYQYSAELKISYEIITPEEVANYVPVTDDYESVDHYYDL